MKKTLMAFVLLLFSISLSAKDYGWYNADHAEDYSWWVFVYENINVPELKYGYYKVWVKWEYTNPKAKAEFKTKATVSKQLYEISYDFSQYRILQVTDYDDNNKVISDCNIPSSRSYFMPETIGEAIVTTVKEILAKHKNE